METLTLVADVAGWFLLGMASLIGADALRSLVGWKSDLRVEMLRKRLADVEALRRHDQWARGEIELDGTISREQAERLARHRLRADLNQCRQPPAGWECTREPGHEGPCAAVPSTIRKHMGNPPYSRPEGDGA